MEEQVIRLLGTPVLREEMSYEELKTELAQLGMRPRIEYSNGVPFLQLPQRCSFEAAIAKQLETYGWRKTSTETFGGGYIGQVTIRKGPHEVLIRGNRRGCRLTIM